MKDQNQLLAKYRIAFNALIKINLIRDKLNGGDWDEIEEARNIAQKAVQDCLDIDIEREEKF